MSRSGAIFLVDDCRDDVTLISYAFLLADIRNPVRWIKDGHTLRQQLECPPSNDEESEMPLLLVIDGNMPGSDSFEMIKWIRRQPRYINLLIASLTGSNDPEQKQRAYEAGANWHLVKSSDFVELTDLVRRVQGFWPSTLGM